MNEVLEPYDVRLSADGGSLEIDWSDDHTTHTELRTLRRRCPCAMCAGEMGSRGRMAQAGELPDDEYVLTGVAPIGRYALAPVWASGHDHGLYTYTYLRLLCECPEHTAAREAQSGSLTEPNHPERAIRWEEHT